MAVILLAATCGVAQNLLAADAPTTKATTKPVLPPSDPPEAKEHKDARMKWFREAKFGMFIHWGLYSVPAGTYDGKKIPGIGEWIMNRGKIPVDIYQKYTSQFTAAKFDADQWMQMAPRRGREIRGHHVEAP